MTKKRIIKRLNIFFLLLIICSSHCYSFNFITTPVFQDKSSSQNDSILKKEFYEIKELYNSKDYVNSLKRALKFGNTIDSSNKNLSYEINFLIGNIFRKNRNYNKSISYYNKALQILSFHEGIDNDLKKINSNLELNYVNIYFTLGNQYLLISKIDSAKYSYKKALSIETLSDKGLSYQASASTNLSGLYRQDTLFDLAKEYASTAIEIHKKRNNKISEATAIGNLASVFLDEKDYNRAKETYNRAIKLIRNEKSERAILVREKLYYNLAYNLFKLKDYEAYTYQELSYDIKDSLRDKEFKGFLEEVYAEYNFESKKELFQKQEELKLLKEKDKTKTIIFISLGASIILLIIIGYYKLRQKNLGLQLSQTKLLQDQKIEKIRSESQIRILNATIDGKETERKEIAETLHDNVSALLSSAKLHLQASKSQFNGNTPLEIDKTTNIITEASEKIRDLSHELVSSVLLKFGLKFAIIDIAKKYSNSQIAITTEIGELRRYNQQFEIKTYNIIQEFVNNILKHSNASKATIQLDEADGILYLQISDNGKGFDKTKITEKDGLGINQIDARIHVMNGEFYIDSEIGRGTNIQIELPILEKETLV